MLTKDQLRSIAKQFGRLAEQFVGAAPRDGQARRTERDAAVHALREAEKLLIQVIEKQPAALATPDTLPPVAVMPEIRSGDRIEFRDTAEVEAVYRSGNVKCWSGAVVEPRHILMIERDGTPLWQRGKE